MLLPLGVAAWLGLEVARDEQRVSRHQFQSLLTSRLRDVDSTITRTADELSRHLLEQSLPTSVPTSTPTSTSASTSGSLAPEFADRLRAIRRDEALIREIFLVDGKNGLLFPPEGAEASADERAFRQRTAAIWRGDAVLYEPPAPLGGAGEGAILTPGSSPSSPDSTSGSARVPASRATLTRAATSSAPRAGTTGDTLIALSEQHPHGWLSWYWEEGMHLLFWRRTDDGHVVGVEIERIVLLARIVAKLPAADLAEGRVVLMDSRGHPMHQWGSYEPPADQPPAATAPVSYPLHAWRLAHYTSPAQTEAFLASSLRVNLILGFAAVALAMLALAFLFYRDYARRMRDAAQRVSFVTQVSHELKTPLTNIRLYAELLDSEIDEDDERGRKRLSVIVAESQRLTRLINNILAFSRKRQNKLDVRKDWIDMDQVVESVLEQFEPALAGKNIEIQATCTATEPVHADADVVGQIVANLISNVEKYAADGGFLQVETEQRDDVTLVRVSDRGPGIPAAQRDKIFRPFYRISDKLADGVTGTGIGLSIARELARLHGGDLQLLPGERGACFQLVVNHNATRHNATRHNATGHDATRSA